MLKKLSNLSGVQLLNQTKQKAITGGNSCIACYDSCMITSTNRIELGDCFDYCQQYVC